jgi:hypothetical protein
MPILALFPNQLRRTILHASVGGYKETMLFEFWLKLAFIQVAQVNLIRRVVVGRV